MNPSQEWGRHSAGDASRQAALLRPQILPVLSVVAPCLTGASPASVLAPSLATGSCLPAVTLYENPAIDRKFQPWQKPVEFPETAQDFGLHAAQSGRMRKSISVL